MTWDIDLEAIDDAALLMLRLLFDHEAAEDDALLPGTPDYSIIASFVLGFELV